MLDRIKGIFRIKPEESDVYLCVGVESLFYGSFQIYPPAAFILLGFIFCGLAYLTASAGGA